MPPLRIVQFVPRPGIIDVGWGHPDPELLPVQDLRAAGDRVPKRPESKSDACFVTKRLTAAGLLP